MPYIKQERRRMLDEHGRPETAGELDYVLTQKCLEFLRFSGLGWGFEEVARIIGVLDLVKDEFKRRMVHPYETRKCEENGDVFPFVDPKPAPDPARYCGWCKDDLDTTGSWHPTFGPVHIGCFHQISRGTIRHIYKSTGAGACGICGGQRGGMHHV